MSKKSFLKRTLAIALAAMLTIGAGPLAGLCGLELPSISSFAASAAEEEPVWTVATLDMLEVEGGTIKGYTSKLSGNIEIPTHIDGTAITAIGETAFKGCTSLTAVKIPDSISSVGGKAFIDCSALEKVYFNSTECKFSSDGRYAAFLDCPNFTEIVFGENVTVIPAYICRSASNLQTVVFNGKVTEIGYYAFADCSSLAGVDLSNVNTIGAAAFKNCISIPSFTFSQDLETIGEEAFYGCKITEITIPEKVSSVGGRAFANCSILEKVYFNSTECKFSSDGRYATFLDCPAFTEIVFGENVTVIPAYICRSASNLQTVTINGLVTTIGTNAFYNCTALSDVYYNEGSEEDWNKVEIKSGNDILSSDDVTIHFGVYPVTKTNEEFGVTVSYINKAFNEEVKLSVTETVGEREKGSVAISDREISEQIGCFNIKMILADGSSASAVQPNGKVTVKMAIPAGYIGKTNFKIVHRPANAPRENFSTNPKADEKKLSVSSDGKYWIFEVTSFSDFEFFAVEAAPTISIKNNSGSKTINYGETLRLTANTSSMPADAKIFWYVDGVKKGEGTTFEVSPESGSVEVTVKVVDTNGNDYADTDISDTEKVTVKSGFFQKLISFFKNLFRISRVVTQAFMVK